MNSRSTLIVGSVVMSLLGGGLARAEHHYYYFKEKRPLALNVDKIAVLASNGVDRSGAWEQLSIAQDNVADFPIQRWQTALTPVSARSDTGIRTIVENAISTGAFEFTSPVFVGEDGGPVIVTPDILVGFKADVSEAQAVQILAASGAGQITDRRWGGMAGVYRLRSAAKNGFDVLAVANTLAQKTEIKFAEPDMIFTGRASLIPDDSLFSSLWGLHNTGQGGGTPDMDMDAPEAWDITIGDPSIIVLVIDTGAQQDHPDIHQIPGNDVTADAPGDGGPVNVCDSHGTAVAGCVSATINNSLGVVGMAPNCVTASARTFISNPACDGSWSTRISDTVDALAWGESIGARVSNNSNFYGFTSASIAQKYTDTRTAGMVHFACAGNDSSTNIVYPGNLPSTVAVTAVDRNGNLASFATTGVGLDFSAPGVSIGTTDRTGSLGFAGGDFAFVSGCSFATPYTAGIAALMLSVDPLLDPPAIEQILQDTAVDLGAPGFDTTFGWGFVNARAALERVTGCTSNTECDDLDPCTLDTCTNFRCSNTLVIDCDDGDVCTFDECVSLACQHTPNTFGDVDNNASINIFDLFCVLRAFGGEFSHPDCTFSNTDVEPCSGNGTINIFDLFAVLNGFDGVDPCCGGLP